MIPAIREIRVVADTSAGILLNLYAGLRAFGRRHSVPVRFVPWGIARFTEHWPSSLWLEAYIDDATEPVFVCIDMADSGAAFSVERVEKCDVYFKRSFDRAQVQRLPTALREKVRPYGIFYRAVESADLTLLWRFVCEFRARRRFGQAAQLNEFQSWALLLAFSWLDPLSSVLRGKRLVIPDQYVASPGMGLGAGVIFQTRLWSPAEVSREKNWAAINDTRAEIVALLRRRLGSQYIGGVMRTPYTLEQYPELITPFPEDRGSYLRLIQSSRVSVITTGIHQSIPGKLGESLAAGRCIVSEPLAYELPVPLEEGRHYLVFRTPEECVAQCQRLLADETLAADMQASNREYYSLHGGQQPTITRCLSVAADVGRARRAQQRL